MSNDKFKNSPIHDKQAIVSMMDELKPEDMVEVVELLKSKQPKQQTAVQEFWDKIALKLSVEQLDEFRPLFEQAREMEKEQMIKFTKDWYSNSFMTHPWKTAEEFYNETYGGANEK